MPVLGKRRRRIAPSFDGARHGRGQDQTNPALTEHEFAFVKQHSPGDIKVTLPTANQFPAIYYKKGISDKVYPDYSAFLWDIVPIIKAEIQALVNEGAQYIQIDAPRYSYYIDPKWRSYVKIEMGLDPDQALDEAIRADNACLEGAKRDGVILAIHLCRGNNRSQWYAEGGYDAIAEKLFGQFKVDAFLLEYESERAGTFEPLRFVPRGKTVVLGLVSSKLAEWNRRIISPNGSTKRASTCRSKTWRSARSAASPRRWKAICSPKSNSGRNSGWWSRLPARCGERFSFDAFHRWWYLSSRLRPPTKGGTMRRLILVALAVVLTLFGSNSRGDSQTIKIGAVVPLTGRYAALGSQVKTGYEIAVQHINAAGGVNVGGKKLPIELMMLDDESDPTKTVAASRPSLPRALSPTSAGRLRSHAAAASIAERTRFRTWASPSLNGIHQQGLRYLFSPFPKSPDLARETFVFLDA